MQNLEELNEKLNSSTGMLVYNNMILRSILEKLEPLDSGKGESEGELTKDNRGVLEKLKDSSDELHDLSFKNQKLIEELIKKLFNDGTISTL